MKTHRHLCRPRQGALHGSDPPSLIRPLHKKAFLQKLRARRALLRELRGRIRFRSTLTISPVPRTRPVHGATPRSPPRKGEVVPAVWALDPTATPLDSLSQGSNRARARNRIVTRRYGTVVVELDFRRTFVGDSLRDRACNRVRVCASGNRTRSVSRDARWTGVGAHAPAAA